MRRPTVLLFCLISGVAMRAGVARAQTTGTPVFTVPLLNRVVVPRFRRLPQNQATRELVVVDRATGQNKVITTGFQDVCPDISPDGRVISFVRYSPGQIHLCLIDGDGKNLRKLVPGVALGSGALFDEECPRFSADGTEIVFIKSTQATLRDVYRVRASAGGGLAAIVPLARGAKNESEARWFPSASKVVFTAKGSGPHQIYSVGRDGTGLQRLSVVSTDFYRFPEVSPAGRWLTYARSRDPLYYPFRPVLYDTVQKREYPLPGSSVSNGIKWSPDGKHVAFACARRVCIARIDLSVPKGTMVTTTDTSLRVKHVAWTRANEVVFNAWDLAVPYPHPVNLYRLRIGGTPVVLVRGTSTQIQYRESLAAVAR